MVEPAGNSEVGVMEDVAVGVGAMVGVLVGLRVRVDVGVMVGIKVMVEGAQLQGLTGSP